MPNFKVPNISESDRERARSVINAKTERQGECLVWTGSKAQGYGVIVFNGWNYMAHRLSFNAFRGDISKGMTLDHLCRNRACVEPKHLEPVSNLVNNRRAHGGTAPETHCIRGHEITPEVSYVNKRGRRICKACEAERTRQRREAGELPTWDKVGRTELPSAFYVKEVREEVINGKVVLVADLPPHLMKIVERRKKLRKAGKLRVRRAA